METNKSNIWPTLATSRMFLAFSVCCWHITQGIPGKTFVGVLSPFGGQGAVAAFLLISGYSIAHSFQHSPAKFYSRRADRIIPVFVFCFIVACIPYMLWGNGFSYNDRSPSLVQLVGNFFFLQGIFVHRLPTLATAWSLSVEVICYALTPWFARLSSKTLLGIAGISLSVFVLHAKFGAGGIADDQYGLSFMMCLWLWLSGFIYYRHKADQYAGLFLIVSGCVGMDLGYSRFFEVFPTTFCLVACIFIWRLTIPTRFQKMANIAGDLSYPLYLIHWPIMSLCFGFNIESQYTILFFAMIGSLIVLYGVDYPSRKLRNLHHVDVKPKTC